MEEDLSIYICICLGCEKTLPLVYYIVNAQQKDELVKDWELSYVGTFDNGKEQDTFPVCLTNMDPILDLYCEAYYLSEDMYQSQISPTDAYNYSQCSGDWYIYFVRKGANTVSQLVRAINNGN